MNAINTARLLWTRFQLLLAAPNATGSGAPDQHVGGRESVLQEYARRLSLRQFELAGIRRRHVQLWAWLTVVAIASCWIVIRFASHSLTRLWVVLPVLALAGIFRLLSQNARVHAGVGRIISFYENGIARLRGEWQGRGIGGNEFQTPELDHLYASDLDLFGAGSIFELLCTARTGVGRATLARWLLQPADCEEVLARQEAVRELRDKLDLREDWACAGDDAMDRVDSHTLEEWAKAAPVAFSALSRICAVALPTCLVVLVLLAASGMAPLGWNWYAPVLVVLAMEAVLAGANLRKTRKIAANIILPSFELSLLGPLLERMEVGGFQCELLTSLQSQLTGQAMRPSRGIRTLARLAWLMELRQNDLATFLAPLLAGTNLAIRIEDWRRKNQTELLRWLEVLGQFEALLCLARHHYENPDWTFPTLRPEAPAFFRAEVLGHPLLKPETCVTCDVEIDRHSTQLMIVSGSNMSGKSTLLRSVGTNAVLALAGAPVCAARMEISTLRVACSISVQDSLRDDRSRFQAEVERLKQVLDSARETGTMFLLDEMLGGTNSQDRLFGARAVIGELLDTGAIGLVTTHDLALTEIANARDGHVRNVHFEEHYADGEMRFDYKLRPGVLARTNGVNVMAALGLLPASKVP